MALLEKVGTFAKSTAAGPVLQSIAGLGFVPKVIILMTAGKTVDGTMSADWRFGFGISTDPSNSYAIGAANAQQDPSNSSRHISGSALTIIDWDENILAQAALDSIDADGFTLDWSTNNASAYLIHYRVLGGSDLDDATVVNWNTGAATGAKSITGAGFPPDFALHFNATLQASLPLTSASAAIMLGATDGTNQWAYTTSSVTGLGTSDSQTGFSSSACLIGINTTSAINTEAAHVAFTSDGQDLNFVSNSGARESLVLFLKGGQYNVGTVQKSTSTTVPVTDNRAIVGFDPTGMTFVSRQRNVTTAWLGEGHIGIGFADGTNEAAIALTDANALAVPNVDGLSKSSKGYVKVNNVNMVIDAEADVSLITDGWSWNWTTNDAINTYISYIAMGSDPPSSGVNHELTGVSLATGSQEGALRVERLLSGLSLGSGSQAGQARIGHPLTGQSLGSGLQTGALRVARRLTGQSLGTGLQAGALRLARRLTGQSLGSGLQSGALRLARRLSGASLGQGSQSGQLTILVITHELTGQSLGTGSQAGVLTVRRALTGISLGQGAGVATLRIHRALAGISLGTGSQSGTLTVPLKPAILLAVSGRTLANGIIYPRASLDVEVSERATTFSVKDR